MKCFLRIFTEWTFMSVVDMSDTTGANISPRGVGHVNYGHKCPLCKYAEETLHHFL